MAKKQGTRPKSKLDERFLTPNTVPPPWGLPFFPNLHKVLSRSWNKPHSSRVFSSQVHVYADIKGLKEYGYGAMAKVEPTLASYPSPNLASSLKAPTLPLKASSVLVGMAAGQPVFITGIPSRPAEAPG